MLPKIKKTIKSYLLEEEGKISKQSVLKIGAALAFSAGLVNSPAHAQCADPNGQYSNSCTCTGSCGSCSCGSCA